MLSTRTKIWRSVILALVAIGLVAMLINETILFLGVLAATILIWYLYRRPPRWLIRLSHPQTASPTWGKPRASTSKSKSRERKKRRFRVIDGNGNRSS
ncbi:hypothetical protein GCM10007416_11050 [Kroppenstedtia guangzhouensis]|uniref:Uncharacterized protein n=1 Tax=Kroppenstedtia guangzhouensis TaxID=1274356 RepID=A0ABQ1GAH1_9BACL|nr:hypothetical protein GCM10007416_11050 [Kroppenstedtia guangzhouensis]